MKHLLLIFSILYTLNLTAQTVNYPVTAKGEYTQYTSKENIIFKVGDTLELGLPYAADGFTYITQNSFNVDPSLAGDLITIVKLKSYGNKNRGYKMYAHFKGYGMAPVLIDLENAIKTNEIIIK